jgi:hypothetical protein
MRNTYLFFRLLVDGLLTVCSLFLRRQRRVFIVVVKR